MKISNSLSLQSLQQIINNYIAPVLKKLTNAKSPQNQSSTSTQGIQSHLQLDQIAGGENFFSLLSKPNQISQKGLEHIAQFEGFRSKSYLDATGHPTIGYGHLIKKGEANKFSQGLTKEQGLQLLKSDAQKASDTVKKHVKVPLNQEQFDALSSFVFNVGATNFKDSTLLKKLNQGQYDQVPKELNRWVYSKGKKLNGLINRRKQEGTLFSQGTQNNSQIFNRNNAINISLSKSNKEIPEPPLTKPTKESPQNSSQKAAKTYHGMNPNKMSLGDLSAGYESGGKGIKTVSSGKGDPGGVSYGTHQLSTNAGTMQAFLESPEGSPFAKNFEGLEPGTKKFNAAYDKVSKDQGKTFDKAQFNYLYRTHYQPALKHAENLGFDTQDRGVQEAIFSGSIQHKGIKKVLSKAAKREDFKNQNSSQQINSFYKARVDYVKGLKKMGTKTKESLITRYGREVKDALMISQARGSHAAPEKISKAKSQELPLAKTKNQEEAPQTTKPKTQKSAKAQHLTTEQKIKTLQKDKRPLNLINPVNKQDSLDALEVVHTKNSPKTGGFHGRSRSQGKKFHGGLDIAVKKGDPIYAAEDGVVVVAKDGVGKLGTAIYIQHRDGTQTRYAHLSLSNQGGLKVKRGDTVKKGELIGLSGKTGNAAGKDITTHLHFEVRKIDDGFVGNPKDSTVDPLPLITQ